MPQRHEQHGIFHITTVTRARISWCTLNGIPEMLIDNLVMTKNVHGAKIYAFCILPDHMHILMSPGEKGLSKFMQSFKEHATKDILYFMKQRRSVAAAGMKRIAWQKGFHDEHINDGTQYGHAVHYIHANAIKHGLCHEIEDWPWTSLHFPNLIDPIELLLD